MAPKHLLPRLNGESIGRGIPLGPMKAQLLADANTETSVAQQSLVIGLGHAIHLSKDKALQGGHGDIVRQ